LTKPAGAVTAFSHAFLNFANADTRGFFGPSDEDQSNWLGTIEADPEYPV